MWGGRGVRWYSYWRADTRGCLFISIKSHNDASHSVECSYTLASGCRLQPIDQIPFLSPPSDPPDPSIYSPSQGCLPLTITRTQNLLPTYPSTPRICTPSSVRLPLAILRTLCVFSPIPSPQTSQATQMIRRVPAGSMNTKQSSCRCTCGRCVAYSHFHGKPSVVKTFPREKNSCPRVETSTAEHSSDSSCEVATVKCVGRCSARSVSHTQRLSLTWPTPRSRPSRKAARLRNISRLNRPLSVGKSATVVGIAYMSRSRLSSILSHGHRG